MATNMTLPCGDGMVNLRVGAIIMKNGKILMSGNSVVPDLMYTVGGRIQFGETAEEAVLREVYEETGVRLEIDRLGFIHESYFVGDMPVVHGKLVYEIAFYFYMKVPEDFEPVSSRFEEDGRVDYLKWIDPDGPERYFPDFFRTELKKPEAGVKHFLTDERGLPQRPDQGFTLKDMEAVRKCEYDWYDGGRASYFYSELDET